MPSRDAIANVFNPRGYAVAGVSVRSSSQARFPAQVHDTGWTLLTGTATVSWTGTLSSARFYVETASGTDNFYLDDASMQ